MVLVVVLLLLLLLVALVVCVDAETCEGFGIVGAQVREHSAAVERRTEDRHVAISPATVRSSNTIARTGQHRPGRGQAQA